MNWRFTIIDRDNTAHLIDEPVGFDAMEVELKRDAESHGMFFNFQNNDLKFDGLAYSLLKAEYEAYRTQGIMYLVIEEACDDNYEELYRGRFLFGKYNIEIGTECIIKIAVEKSTNEVDFTSKLDQKVNLEATTAFDNTTALLPYTKLPFQLELPSKGILLQDSSKKKNNVLETLSNGLIETTPPLTPQAFVNIELGIETVASEIGNYGFWDNTKVNSNIMPIIGTENISAGFTGQPTQQLWDSTISDYVVIDPVTPNGINTCDPNVLSPIVNFQPETANYDTLLYDTKLAFTIAGEIEPLVDMKLSSVALHFTRKRDGVFTQLYSWNIFSLSAFVYPPSERIMGLGNKYRRAKFNISYVDNAFDLRQGDMLYLFIGAFVEDTNASISANLNNFLFTTYDSSFFRLSAISKTPNTFTKAFMINECFSRIVESITNNQLKVYSNLFGRTDSQPYTQLQDGNASMVSITKGLFVRRQDDVLADRPPVFSLSFKDLFDGIEPIFPIGYAIEDDDFRPGFKRLRIEPWTWFYKNEVVFICDGVNEVKKKVLENKHYSLFKFGYERYEAEQYNGLDEFLTKRTYRTSLNGIKNELTKLSKFIASGYAIEVTRRVGNTTSSDWRFDNETFIICCKRNELNEFVVELGNVSNPTAIIDPDTIYNYRISPVRNALRWMKKIAESYVSNPELFFTDGEGNFYAKGKMLSSFARDEANEIAENDPINTAALSNPSNASPILIPESVEYSYPLSVAEYNAIKANPYGLIQWSTENESGEGWIDTMKYKPEEGLADFTLIPKIV